MSSLEIIKSLYKPYRYTINKNVMIAESTSGKFVIKKQNKDVLTLFNYLENRGFTDFPKIVKNYRNSENVFEYIEQTSIPNEQKLLDMAEKLASLHNKTVYFKTTSADNYKEIRETVENNLKYLDNYYNTLFISFLNEEFMSPAKYLFCRNFYKIRQSILFCKEEIDLWYEMVKEEKKVRVAVVHNNLSLDHFIVSNDKNAFISWDNYKIDTPILDFVSLYQKEYLNNDFSPFLNKYLNTFELLESEKKLMFILISIPLYFTIDDTEFNNTKIVKEKINYLYQTEQLIRPYYSKEEIKE